MMVGRRGYPSVKVITKPCNAGIFGSMGFETIGRSDKAIFMENSMEPLSRYCSYLRSLRVEGRCGVIVINANPFTRGHRYLIEIAAREVDHLFIIPVKEERSVFPYTERKKMIEEGTRNLKNVTVCRGSAYTVSSSTFPSYFIKRLSDLTDSQIQVDLDIFSRYIAPSLNASVRFVGSEPTDPLTNRYNELMIELLPPKGIQVRCVERKSEDGIAVSASRVRKPCAAARSPMRPNLWPTPRCPISSPSSPQARCRKNSTPLRSRDSSTRTTTAPTTTWTIPS